MGLAILGTVAWTVVANSIWALTSGRDTRGMQVRALRGSADALGQ